MKPLGLLIAAIVLASSSAWAGCKNGEQLELTGSVSRIYQNKGGGWSVVVGHLNDAVLGCELGLLMGRNTATPWFVLAVKTRPSPQCHAGSSIRAMLKLSENLGDFDTETVSWQCN
jgi:hypothetical protein